MSSETRYRLIQATKEILVESGIGSVTLRGVGAHSGLSRGAVYRHFKDKEDLIGSIATELMLRNLIALKEIIATNKVSKETLKLLLNTFFMLNIDPSFTHQLLLTTSWDREKFQDFHRYGKEKYAILVDFIDKLKNKLNNGDIHKNPLNSSHLTTMAFSFTLGLVNLHVGDHKEESKGLDNIYNLISEFVDTMFRE